MFLKNFVHKWKQNKLFLFGCLFKKIKYYFSKLQNTFKKNDIDIIKIKN